MLTYYGLIKEFGKISGALILISTSFNVRGEPIVRMLEEAVICFLKLGIDCLILSNHLILKKEQKYALKTNIIIISLLIFLSF